jgi:hypothetical protein
MKLHVALPAACIAVVAALPARAQNTPAAPADSAVRAAPPAAHAPAPRVRRNPNVITAAELEGQVATDAYELVRRLRPQWLRVRPSGTNEDAARTPAYSAVVSAPPRSELATASVLHVVVDGAQAGEIGELRRIDVANLRELRYVPSADAITRWGRDYSAGVIEVFLR